MALNQNIRQVLDAVGVPYCCVIRVGDHKLAISTSNRAFRELFSFALARPEGVQLEQVPGFRSPELLKIINGVFDRDSLATTWMGHLAPDAEEQAWKLTCIPLADTRGQNTSVLLLLTLAGTTAGAAECTD